MKIETNIKLFFVSLFVFTSFLGSSEYIVELLS